MEKNFFFTIYSQKFFFSTFFSTSFFIFFIVELKFHILKEEKDLSFFFNI